MKQQLDFINSGSEEIKGAQRARKSDSAAALPLGRYRYSVAVNAPLPELLTYAAQENLEIGTSVYVSLRNRKTEGLILETLPLVEDESKTTDSPFKIKNISAVNEERPRLSQVQIKWLHWLSSYYRYPIGQIGEMFFPPLPRKTNRKTKKKNVVDLPNQNSPSSTKSPIRLSSEQHQAYQAISKQEGFGTHLLFGVTGSGKTEVYLQILEDILAKQQSAIVLVPEISLTPQLIRRFADRLGPQVAAIHSHLTEREKTNQWWSAISGEKSVLIGARSALFCPLKNLGCIIIDEEHESSYKQDETFRYHARDSAIMLGKLLNIPVILGSATPSLESWHNALTGKFFLHELKSRVTANEMPSMEIVDLRRNKDDVSQMRLYQTYPNLPSWLSPELYVALHETLARKEQAALFLNRRGLAQTVLCPACGHHRECPNCSISLTLHGRGHLLCHYCEYHETLKDVCPDCREGELETVGLGTERVEEDLKVLFPEFRVARADRDEIQNRTAMETLIREMENHEIDILVGTQMIAKGLDFPKLKLVGLVLADIAFHLPDFRATERSFQLITQMSGRSGRHVQQGEQPGRVLIQTYNPDHPSIQFAIKHDYRGFAEFELSQREILSYPPFGRLVSIRGQSLHLNHLEKGMALLKARTLELQSKNPRYEQIEVLGPVEAPIARLRGQHRHHMLLKGQGAILRPFVSQLLDHDAWIPEHVRLLVDVDPMNLL